MSSLLEENNYRIKQAIGLLVVIGLIIFAFAVFVDLKVVRSTLKTADPRYLLIASLFLLAGLVVFAARWRWLLGNKPDLLPTFHASNIGHLGNILVPARAGEAVRVLVMGRSGKVTTTAAASGFLVERLFEQVMRLAALGGAVVYGVGLEVSVGTVAGGLGFVVLAFLGIWWTVNHQETVLVHVPVWLAKLPRVSESRARHLLKYVLENLSAVSQPRQLVVILVGSIITWACFALFFYETILALGETFLPHERLAVSLGALALSPPSAVTQPGVFHASVVAPLTAAGFQAEPLTAYAVLLHILEMVWVIGLAIWGLTQTNVSFMELLQRPPTNDR